MSSYVLEKKENEVGAKLFYVRLKKKDSDVKERVQKEDS